MCCLLFHSHLFFELENSTWSYERSLLEAAEETMSSGSEALLFLRDSGFIMECLYERTVKSASLICFKGNLTRLRSSTMGQLFLDSFVRCPGLGSYTVWPRPVSNPVSNNIHRTTFIVLSSTAPAIMREFTVVPLGQSRSAPGSRQLVGQAELQTSV